MIVFFVLKLSIHQRFYNCIKKIKTCRMLLLIRNRTGITIFVPKIIRQIDKILKQAKKNKFLVFALISVDCRNDTTL